MKMKRVLLALLAMIGGLNAHAEDVMEVTPFKITGQSGAFEVALQNTKGYKAFQVDLLLPSGLTLDGTTPFALKSERNSQNIGVFAYATAPDYLVPAGVPSGYTYYRVVAYDAAGGTSKSFNGTSGAILTVNYASHSLTDGAIYNAYTTNMEFVAAADNAKTHPSNNLETKASSYFEVGTAVLVDPVTKESNIVLSDYVPVPVVDQLQASVDNGALSVDLTNVSNMGKTLVLTGEKANVMQVVSQGTDIATVMTMSNTPNVIVKNGENYSCANFNLTDKVDYKPSVEEFTATKVIYNRTNTGGLNSVCLPFDVNVNDFDGCDVYVFKRVNSTTVRFNQQLGGSVEAGTPMLVQDKSLEPSPSWEFDVTNKLANNEPIAAEGDGAEGAYVKRTLGDDASYYKLNSDGTAFGKAKATHTITPFRFYIKTSGAAPTNQFTLELGDADGNVTYIGGITVNGDVTSLYDLQGRPVLTPVKGQTYVKDGKKVMF